MVKNLMMCFPRSGNNLIRYTIEFLTKRPTVGTPKLVPQNKDKEILDRSHNPEAKLPHILGSLKEGEECKILLLLRNYKESIIRHASNLHKFNLNSLDIKEFLNLKCWPSEFNSPSLKKSYCNTLRTFHNYKGNKLLIYYEDLIKDYEKELRKIIEFFQLKKEAKEDIEEFFKYKKYHFQESIKHYAYNSITKGNHIIFHSKDLTKEQLRIYDREILDCIGKDIYSKYLLRYLEKC